MRHSFAGWATAVVLACSPSAITDDWLIEGDPSSASLAIVDVNVIAMDANRTLSSQTVLIENGRIAAVGPSSSVQVQAGTTRINGKGRYLLPGLIDMHVHIRSSELDRYLPAGVTTVRNMWGYEELGQIIRDVESGARKGPQIYSLTAGFDASPPQWPQTQISDDPRAIPALIDHQYNLGYREIKVYQKLSRAAYDTIVAVAHRKGMTFAGHMPPSVGLVHVLESGQRSIEHLGGYFTGPGLSAQVAATVQAGTYNCPTISVQSGLNGESRAQVLRQITAALHAGGAKLLVGTDAGIDVTQPGSSIHDELDQFVRAGLPPFDALLGATRTAAEYLGKTSEIGTIAVGKEADLILLRANPLRDISATRGIDAVIVNGRILQ